MAARKSPTIATLATRIADANGRHRLPADAIAALSVLTGTHGQKDDHRACAGSVHTFLRFCAPGIASDDRAALRVKAGGW